MLLLQLGMEGHPLYAGWETVATGAPHHEAVEQEVTPALEGSLSSNRDLWRAELWLAECPQPLQLSICTCLLTEAVDWGRDRQRGEPAPLIHIFRQSSSWSDTCRPPSWDQHHPEQLHDPNWCQVLHLLQGSHWPLQPVGLSGQHEGTSSTITLWACLSTGSATKWPWLQVTLMGSSLCVRGEVCDSWHKWWSWPDKSQHKSQLCSLLWRV